MTVWPRRESSPQPPALQSRIVTLPTELILPIAIKGANRKKSLTMDSGRGSVGLGRWYYSQDDVYVFSRSTNRFSNLSWPSESWACITSCEEQCTTSFGIPNRLINNWLRGHEGERNNCFSKIQLVGQKYRDKTTLASKTRFSRHCFGFQSRRFLLLVGYNK